ncbi:hypothetical protein BV372_08005 [Nostoc sp. T09]|uniref:hypothetical protein n=1 Tax=Nostoc sp. T09 TaxID=1932621 RepID=UPI000A3988BF|nr:hypothetical protein [Nostoc sp. T09]OUL36352.1 hypothetical protein BV372_08005 [Nostoc sp. T09]
MEILETYHNGQLVEVTEVESIPLPNISQFNTQMMLADSYSRLIANTVNQQWKTRLEIAAVRLELKPEITQADLETFKFIWDNVVDAVPSGILTSVDGEEWNQISTSNNMPFYFGDDFKMIVRGE